MPVTAAQLAGFLDWLRDGGSGFEAGDQQYLAAQMLAETLAARAEWPAESVAWRTLLAPVLSSSPAQQQRLYELLDQWFAAPVSPAPTSNPDNASLAKKSRRPIPREAWLYGSLCLVLISALLAGAIRYWPRHPHALPPPTHSDTPPPLPVSLPKGPVNLTVQTPNGLPLPDATVHYAGASHQTNSAGVVALDLPTSTPPRYLVVTKPGYRSVAQNFPSADTLVTLQPAAPPQLPHHLDLWWIRHAPGLRIAVMLVSGILLLLWLVRLFRKALELRKWATTSEPRMRRIATSSKTEPLYPAADIRRLAVALRRRRPEESPELDLQSTVETTCRQAGYFSPVFATRNSEPEYLFLGERKNLRDHQARMQDELIRRLRDHDVYVQRYYFQSTPSTCSDANGDVFSLNDLAAMHPDNEVWLALDASRCLDPVSGMPEKWWGHFSHWRYRTLLSFSRAEVDSELRISDPTRKGIEDLVVDTQPASGQPAKDQPYPSVLRDSPDSWLTRIEPPPAAIARLNAQLQMFLGAHGYLLLQATAVYPEIAWNITATLAGVLVPATEREFILNRLACLPWFRHGVMPDWLRVRLLSRLGPNEERVRSAVRRYLDTSVDNAPQKEEALEVVPGAPRRGSSRRSLRDNVYLAFASGRKLDQLSVQAPKGWRKFLRDSVWLRVGLALVIMASIWVVTNKVMNRLVEKSRHLTAPTVAPPPDPYVTALMQVAEAKEGSMDPHPADGFANLEQYSAVASDVLNINDPWQSSANYDIFSPKHMIRSGAPLLPGMGIWTAHGFDLVKAVSGDNVLTFGSPDYIPRSGIDKAYDLSGLSLTPRASANPDNQLTADAVEMMKRVAAEMGMPNTIVKSPDGKLLASGQSDGSINISNVQSGYLLKKLNPPPPASPFQILSWSPDSRQLTAIYQGTTRVWDVTTGQLLQTTPNTANSATQVASLRSSCDAGATTDCTKLGLLYATGAGVNLDYSLAAELYRKGCDGGDPLGCNGLGTLYEFGQGVPMDLARAALLFQQALSIDQKAANRSGQATDLGNLAEVSRALAKLQEAQNYLAEALQLYRDAGNQGGQARTLHDLGMIEADQGDSTKTLDFFNQALSMYRATGDRAGEATTLVNIGSMYEITNQPEKALDYFNLALPIFTAIGDRDKEAIVLVNLGSAYDSLKKPQTALDFFNKALPLAREVGNKEQEASVLSNLGSEYQALGQSDKAEDYLKQALALDQMLADGSQQAYDMSNLAEVYKAKGEIAAARQLLQQALTIDQQAQDTEEVKRVQGMLNSLPATPSAKSPSLQPPPPASVPR